MLVTKPRVLAIIPARGGSKRLPRKNILPLNSKPLVQYSIDAALSCKLITDIIVSSDSDEICQLASQERVIVIKRPQALAEDRVSNEHVVEHAIRVFAETQGLPEYIVLLQPTSPLRTAQHLEECLAAFFVSKMKSVMSVCQVEHHPAKYLRMIEAELKPYTSEEDVEKQSQLLEALYRQNGAIYALKTVDFLENLKFYQPPCLPFIMPVAASVDIDSLFDLNFCEFLEKAGTTNINL